MIDELKEKGWFLSAEGIESCQEGLAKATVAAIISKALDTDLREIGAAFLSEEIYKNKVEYITGPCVLQIQKIKNVSVPKYDSSNIGPALYRLHVTDGITVVSCLQCGYFKSVNMDTPPGTKIFLRNVKVPVQNGFLLLSENHFTVLGGQVPAMVEKWELTKRLASHVRRGDGADDGPPPWIPFGKSISYKDSKVSNNDFKSLEQEVKAQKEDVAFKQQRQATIAEVSKAKEGKVKVFGGGKEKPFNGNAFEKPSRNNYEPYRNRQSGSNDGSMDFYSPAPLQQKGRETDMHEPKADHEHTFNYRSENKPDWQSKKYDSRTRSDTSKRQSAAQPQDYKNNFEDAGSRTNNYERTSYQNHMNRNDNFASRMSQLNIHENKSVSEVNNTMQLGVTHLSRGEEVMARYWEDKKFYFAIIHEVGRNGTCVVHFVEYGNYEEVRVSDIRPVTSNSNKFSDFQHSAQITNMQYPPEERDNFTGVLEFRRGGNKPFVHRSTNENQVQDRERTQRYDQRTSAKLHQVPHYRQDSYQYQRQSNY